MDERDRLAGSTMTKQQANAILVLGREMLVVLKAIMGIVIVLCVLQAL